MRYITLVEVVLFAYLMWTIVNCKFKKKSYRFAALFRRKQKKTETETETETETKTKTKQNKAKQNKTKQNKTKQNKNSYTF